MNREIKSNGFNKLVDKITEKMVETIKNITSAVISGNQIAEYQYRAELSSYDRALFSIVLYSSVVDKKEQDGTFDPNAIPF